MDLGLKDKTAFVAGASKGLGKAIAYELSKEGALVAICARDMETLLKTAEEIQQKTKNRVFPIRADVSDVREAVNFLKKGIDELGTIHILINNAGGPPASDFLSTDFSAWEEAFRLNLMSAIAMCKTAIPVMQANKWGRIVNITSVAVKQPIDELILSNTIRAGVHGLAKSLSNKFAGDNICINNVCPGYTMTERVENLAKKISENESVPPDIVKTRWCQNIPMKRIGKPEELAAIVAFLASTRASYITGTTIQVDGGFHKGLL